VTSVYDATWYDTAMTESDAPSMRPLEESPWREMYETLAGMIAPHEEVVDLGCGTGRFIELLRRNSHYARVTGIDWSPAALEEALEYYGGNADEPRFHLEDLRSWHPDPQRAGNTVYVCSEVMEHLSNDIALVREIPPGHRFLFTVPNFDSESHVRTFPRVGDLWERYAGLLLFRSWQMIGTEHKGIHVVESVRRSESW
jgi:trans-aconitate methyltransferase